MKLLLFLLLALPARAVEAPVAVMPFRNLGPAKLSWLEGGIPETMIADLRRGKIGVVERAQLEKAIQEVSSKEVDPQTAVKIGRLVGAKTIVVGSVQQAGR